MRTTRRGGAASPPGRGWPREIRAANSQRRVLLPRPGSPSRIVILPAASRPGESQCNRSGETRLKATSGASGLRCQAGDCEAAEGAVGEPGSRPEVESSARPLESDFISVLDPSERARPESAADDARCQALTNAP